MSEARAVFEQAVEGLDLSSDGWAETLNRVQSRRRHRIAGMVAAGLMPLLIVGGVVVAGLPEARLQPHSGTGGFIERPTGSGPFAQGRRVNVAEATAAAGYHLFRPNSPQASDPSLQAVWYDGATKQVAFEYKSGIEVFLQPQAMRCPHCPAPAVLFQKQAKELGKGVRVVSILGVPALLIPPNLPARLVGRNYVRGSGDRGVVALLLKGVYIEVTGPADSARLLEVAASLQ